MNEQTPATANTTQPRDSVISTAHAVYALHSLSVLIGATSIITIAGAFVFGIPSIIAVIVNYANRSNAQGTWVESHFRWQIRTFWFALLWAMVAGFFFVTIIGFFIGWIVAIIAGLWVLYRIIRGWIALANRDPVPQA